MPIASLLRIEDHPQFVTWSAWIISLDTLTRLPLAKLRLDGRPRKYVFVTIAGIMVNIGLVVFFYTLLPHLATANPGGMMCRLYDPTLGAGYVVLANLAASAVTLILLARELFSVRFEWDNKLFREMLIYSIPLVIVGFGGVINETFDRIMLGWWSAAPTEMAKKTEVGIYSACYKLSLLITLFVQAFRMGAEPFFFQQAKGEGAPQNLCPGDEIFCHYHLCHVPVRNPVPGCMEVFHHQPCDVARLRRGARIAGGQYVHRRVL